MSVKTNAMNNGAASTAPIIAARRQVTITPPPLTPAQQAFQNQNYVDFQKLGNDMSEGNKLLISKGFNTRNTGQPGSGSNNVITLKENVGSDLSQVPEADKLVHNISQKALLLAKSKGIKNGTEFLDRADELMKEVGGADYVKMRDMHMIPNLGLALSRIYDDKITGKTFSPAENRYTYNQTTGKLVPINQTAASTPPSSTANTDRITQAVEQARTQPGGNVKLKISNK